MALAILQKIPIYPIFYLLKGLWALGSRLEVYDGLVFLGAPFPPIQHLEMASVLGFQA